MADIVDNLIAYRVLSMLVKPFTETDAYRLGIIDATGRNLIRAKDLKTAEQKNAYTYLHRLVFNLKKMLNQLPGGDAKFKNLVAAMVLVRESYARRTVSVDEGRLFEVLEQLDRGMILVEDHLLVEDFLIAEDAVANVTGPGVSTDAPVIRRKQRRFAHFTVNDDVYGRFSNGKAKFRKWSSYLNLENDGERTIYEFARKNPNGVIVLHNGKNSKAIRFNRKGGGSWSKTKRPVKQINNDVVD